MSTNTPKKLPAVELLLQTDQTHGETFLFRDKGKQP